MDPLFSIPEDLAGLTVEELRSFIDAATEIVEKVAAAPAEFAEGRDLMGEMTSGVAAIEAARAELESREPAVEETEEAAPVTAEVDAEALEALAARVRKDESEDESEEVAEEAEEAEEVVASAEEADEAPEAEEAEEAEEPVVASAEPKPKAQLPRPARSRAAAPPEQPKVTLTAAAEYLGFGLGEELPDATALAKMQIQLRRRFGNIPEGTHGEKIPVARADWSDLYPEERRLGEVAGLNMEKVEAVTADAQIRASFKNRQKQGGSMTASGGLCAPVTPYYQLQMLSIADRPVRAALPSFNADRGGIKYARPASLAAITDAVGIITEAEDSLGGTFSTKSCQVIDCPPFQETDVDTIFRCLQFGNLGARTFPELVAQWNSLVLAAHARTAETNCLDAIRAASTAVTATDIGLGATGALAGQVLAAANGMRNRHRMNPEAVLRVLLPDWSVDLLVSDVIRSQFQRFDTDEARVVALLRSFDIEPTFYIDGATGRGQVFGTQAAAALLGFPSTVEWYMYPEGSFLYLDGGTLELGLVRDSVLNSTNDFQIFGESFENVAFVGIESLAVTSTICDSGAVTAPVSITECGDYGNS